MLERPLSMWFANGTLFNVVGEVGKLVNKDLPALAKLFGNEIQAICLFVNPETEGSSPFSVSVENSGSLSGLHCIIWIIKDGAATRANIEQMMERERQMWAQYDGASHGGQPSRGHDRWIILEEATEASECDLVVEIA